MSTETYFLNGWERGIKWEKHQETLDTMAEGWKSPRKGAHEATAHTIDRIKNGETIVFVYPYGAASVVDRIIEESGAVGQFRAAFYYGMSDPLLEVSRRVV